MFGFLTSTRSASSTQTDGLGTDYPKLQNLMIEGLMDGRELPNFSDLMG